MATYELSNAVKEQPISIVFGLLGHFLRKLMRLDNRVAPSFATSINVDQIGQNNQQGKLQQQLIALDSLFGLSEADIRIRGHSYKGTFICLLLGWTLEYSKHIRILICH